MYLRRRFFIHSIFRINFKCICILVLTSLMIIAIYITTQSKLHYNELYTDGAINGLYTLGVNIIVLSNISIDPSKVIGAVGGENLMEVANQPESNELLHFQHGFIRTYVETNITEKLLHSYETNLIDFIKSMKLFQSVNSERTNYYKEKVVFIVTRVEYANLYHTMTDWYNAFLTMKLLNLKPTNIHILIADGHPIGNLDEVWSKLFHNSLSRIGAYRLPYRTNLHRALPIDNKDGLLHIAKLVLVPYGYASPLYVDRPLIKNMFIEEFRQFIFQSYNINNDEDTCQKRTSIRFLPKIVIVSRRDYIAHPRNINGTIHRKITNELELLNKLNQLGFQNSKVVCFTDLTMQEQLKLIMSTDILIGMHGAALTYSLLLSNTSCVIELFPNYCCQTSQHFLKLTKLRHIHYTTYYGLAENDMNGDTSYIPVDIFKSLVFQTYRKWKKQIQKKHMDCL
uniref:Glycoprotein 2-beta-D-xylosyltransferase n=1 Tax=Schistosoma japonicum TaxID=6182 RepID=C1LGM8_SCHJA|nr:glycoprotein 2-beta-D-xylosyltransferase [Schistosoma japonicum]